MGEEEKKPAAEDKMEEKKPVEATEEATKPTQKEEKKAEDSKEESQQQPPPPPPPPPPQEIVLKVFMHCEGCARKVRRSLQGFEGVEDVITDCKSSKVVVKGEKADPLKVLDRVQRKSHRQVQLISPIPKPPSEEEKKAPEEKPEPPKPEEKKEEPQVVTVVLKVYMHCEACAMEIKKRIQRMKGVESAEPDLKSSEVTVQGVFEPQKLVEYVYKRTGKHAVIVKQEPEPEKKEENKESKEEKKPEGHDNKEQKGNSDSNIGTGGDEEKNSDVIGKDNEEAPTFITTTDQDFKAMEVMRRNEPNYYYYYPPSRYTEMYTHQPYPPQLFSDENPNACSVM